MLIISGKLRTLKEADSFKKSVIMSNVIIDMSGWGLGQISVRKI